MGPYHDSGNSKGHSPFRNFKYSSAEEAGLPSFLSSSTSALVSFTSWSALAMLDLVSAGLVRTADIVLPTFCRLPVVGAALVAAVRL